MDGRTGGERRDRGERREERGERRGERGERREERGERREERGERREERGERREERGERREERGERREEREERERRERGERREERGERREERGERREERGERREERGERRETWDCHAAAERMFQTGVCSMTSLTSTNPPTTGLIHYLPVGTFPPVWQPVAHTHVNADNALWVTRPLRLTSVARTRAEPASAVNDSRQPAASLTTVLGN